MTAIIIDSFGNREEVSDREFFRRAFGREPTVRTAEQEAERARRKLIAAIEKVEFARANREREAIIRDGIINGTGDYQAWRERLDRPFAEARARVNTRLA